MLTYAVSLANETDSLRTYNLKEVEITEKLQKRDLRSSTPQQTLTAAELEKSGASTLSDAVKRFSGVSVKDYGGVGGVKTVCIRSMGAQHTGVSYDGVSVSDCQSGQTDISRFSLDNVSQLSLSIGQDDDIFQAAKMLSSAGVLYIHTQQPIFTDKRSSSLRATVQAGSFGYVMPSLSYSQKLNENISFNACADYTTTNGNYPFSYKNGNIRVEENRSNSDVEALHTEINLFGRITADRQLDAKLYYYQSERGLPGSVIIDKSYARERCYDENFFANIRYSDKLNRQTDFKAILRYNYSWDRYTDSSNTVIDHRFRQQEIYNSVMARYRASEKFTFSLAHDFSYNYLHNNFQDCPFPRRYSSLTALAGQYNSEKLRVTASLLNTYIIEKVESGEKPDDRKRLSPALSLSFQPWIEHSLRLRASYKDIFRSPTLNDLYYLRIGNAGLKPEITRQINLGLTWSISPVSWIEDLTFTADTYYNKVKDKIIIYATMFVSKMANIGEVETYGSDLTMSSILALDNKNRLFINGAYSYTRATDRTSDSHPIYSKTYGDQIPYTPKHSGSMSVSYDNPVVNIGYTLVFASERYYLDQNKPANRINGYADHSLWLQKELKIGIHRLQLKAEALNISDDNYEIVKFYPMPGRNYRFTIKYQF